MTHLEALRLAVVPGTGVVARFPGVVLVVPGPEERHRAALDELVTLCGSAGPVGDGRRLARRVAGLIATTDPEDVPDFALLTSVDGEATAVLVLGDVEVVVDAAGGDPDTLSGSSAATWLDRVVVGEAFDVSGTGGSGAGYEASGDLIEGVVPGAGATLATREAPGRHRDAPAALRVGGERAREAASPLRVVPPSGRRLPSAPTERPDRLEPAGDERGADQPAEQAQEPARDFHLVSLDEQDPPLPPLPLLDCSPASEAKADEVVMVKGVLCPEQHLNHPGALFCNSCGRSMVHFTRVEVEGPRPPLGVLVLDGRVFTLDGDYVVGREPERDQRVAAGELRGLVLDDPDERVSRVHAEIRLSGWDVLALDRSSNGTYVADAGSDDWRALLPDELVTLPPGGRLKMGPHVLQFESWHRA